MGNLLLGILLVVIGILGLRDAILTRKKLKEDPFGSSYKYVFGSAGLIMVGIFLLIKHF